METKTIKIGLISFFVALFLVFCSKNNPVIKGQVLNTFIQQEIIISSGDTLKINLGNFGDEESASIYKNPQHAKVNRLYRLSNSNSIVYEYFPLDNFIGIDTVSFILNRGSDGSVGSERDDTTRINILVEK